MTSMRACLTRNQQDQHGRKKGRPKEAMSFLIAHGQTTINVATVGRSSSTISQQTSVFMDTGTHTLFVQKGFHLTDLLLLTIDDGAAEHPDFGRG